MISELTKTGFFVIQPTINYRDQSECPYLILILENNLYFRV